MDSQTSLWRSPESLRPPAPPPTSPSSRGRRRLATSTAVVAAVWSLHVGGASSARSFAFVPRGGSTYVSHPHDERTPPTILPDSAEGDRYGGASSEFQQYYPQHQQPDVAGAAGQSAPRPTDSDESHQHYQHAEQRQYHANEQRRQPDYHEAAEANAQSHPEQEPEDEPFQAPRIRLEHMAMALRLTSEWNRKLVRGVSQHVRFWQGGLLSHATPHSLLDMRTEKPHQRQLELQPQLQAPLQPQFVSLQQRGGDSQPVNVHPSRQWNPPIEEGVLSDVDPELTIFHAKSPRAERRGVSRWGPDLLPYLQYVCKLLSIDSECVEVPLAMIYMDRACSVETPRSGNIPPCPFCSPRTVHRLSLAALLLSVQAVQGGSIAEYYHQYHLQSLGVPVEQLQNMVDWLQGALGDRGLLVTVDEMREFGETWDSIFEPEQQMEIEARHEAMLRAQQERLQQQQQQMHQSPYASVMAMPRGYQA